MSSESPTPSPRIRDLRPEERPREKLASRGAASLTDAELLAIFFRTGLQGKSAIDLGKELLDRFGSLQGISRRSLEELKEMPGIGDAKATQLAGIFEFGRRLAREAYCDREVDSPEAVYELVGVEMRQLSQESLRVILLDARAYLIQIAEITRGSVDESIAHPREIFRSAISYSASSFILVHNHPSGNPSPSSADISLTRKLREASELLQIVMWDHVIIGAPSPDGQDAPYFSFREMGML